MNSLHTYVLLTDKFDENTSILISAVRMILTCYVSNPFMRAFQCIFRTAVAYNFIHLVPMRLYLNGFLHILHSVIPTMLRSLKSIYIYIYIYTHTHIYIYKEKSVSLPKRKAFKRRAGILHANGRRGGGGGGGGGGGSSITVQPLVLPLLCSTPLLHLPVTFLSPAAPFAHHCCSSFCRM